jgi:hypothetical protein
MIEEDLKMIDQIIGIDIQIKEEVDLDLDQDLTLMIVIIEENQDNQDLHQKVQIIKNNLDQDLEMLNKIENQNLVVHLDRDLILAVLDVKIKIKIYLYMLCMYTIGYIFFIYIIMHVFKCLWLNLISKSK